MFYNGSETEGRESYKAFSDLGNNVPALVQKPVDMRCVDRPNLRLEGGDVLRGVQFIHGQRLILSLTHLI